MQLFIISSLLSGTIHFSVPMFLFIIYILFDSNKTNIEKMEGKWAKIKVVLLKLYQL